MHKKTKTSKTRKDNAHLNEIMRIVRHNQDTHLSSRQLTPQMILYEALENLIGLDGGSVDNFEHELICNLSLLATNGADTEVFGKDFNDLFVVLICALNAAGRMKQLLDDNGISFDLDDLEPPSDSKI